ncbi:MAG: hypothetical protein WCF19_05360 [Chlamydiales bacterium]
MNHHYLKTLEAGLQNPEVTREGIKAMLENMDFFLKVLRVKIESKDPEMQKQAMEELREFQTLLQQQSIKTS